MDKEFYHDANKTLKITTKEFMQEIELLANSKYKAHATTVDCYLMLVDLDNEQRFIIRIAEIK